MVSSRAAGGSCEVRALVEGGTEPFGAELLREVAHPGQPAVLPIAQLTEDLGHTAAELDGLIGADEDVDVGGHALPVGESTADQHVEADRAVRLLGRPQPDVVDLDPGTVLRATGDCDLELAGQVGVLPVSGEKGRDGLCHRQSLDDLVRVDARHRARADVARRVAARLDRRQPDVPETLPNPGHVCDADPVQLNVLPGREVGVPVAEDRAVVGALGKGVGRHTDLAHLGSGHHPAGHLDPHHEGIASLALRIHADPLEAFLLPWDLGDGVGTLFGVRVDDRLRHLERMPRQLQLLDGVELADVPVGPDELEPAVTTTAELHPIGVVEVARH